MKIAIVGFGKMGQAIKAIAESRGHSTVTIDRTVKAADFYELTVDSLQAVDVAIDFTTPTAVMDNIAAISKNSVALVVGTTGWYEQESKVRELIKANNTGFLYASNFSLGIHIYLEVAKKAAQIFNKFADYDVAGLEFHHNKKADSPSGTAITIAETLLEQIERKTQITYDKIDRQIAANELQFSSLRCGAIPGTHEVIFDSEVDTISLKHTARSRNGFALGAVIAAEWLVDKKGFYTMSDFMQAMLK